jgi:hypothetical protein
MQNVTLRLACVGLAGLVSATCANAANADIRVFAAGGLVSMKPQDSEQASDKALTGIEGKVAGHFDILSPVPGIAVYAGPELRMGTLSREYTSSNIATKQTIKSKSAGLEAGVHVGIIPIVTLQAGLNYSFPMGGTAEFESPLSNVSFDASSGSETGVTLRGLITPFPLTRLGLEYSLGSGKLKYSDLADELKYDFWAARAVFGIAL